MAKKKLVRSTNKVLAGICGGIAEYFDMDPTLVRVIYAALTIFTTGFPGIILYLIMLLIVPEAGPNDNIDDAEVVE